MARRPPAPSARPSSAGPSVRRPDALTVAAALTLAVWLAFCALVLATQPTGDAPMRSVPVVTDHPAETHVVIEGALP